MGKRTAPILLLAAVLACQKAEKSKSPTDADDSTLPHDATALCMDNSWSSTLDRRVACSQHRGIRVWFGPPPDGATARCRDGTYSTSPTRQGSCADHDGVMFWYDAKPPGSG